MKRFLEYRQGTLFDEMNPVQQVVAEAINCWINEYDESYLHPARGYRMANQAEETHTLTTRTFLKSAC